MYLAVKAICDRNTTTWQTLPAFADAYTEFETHVSNIQTLAQNQSVKATGLAADKQKLRKDMAAAAATIALAVNAYAKKVKNNDLAARTNFTASDMTGGRDTVAAETARKVHEAATANLANLASYGVTAAKLADLKAKIDAYAASITKPRDAVASGRTATQQLAAEFAAADAVLNDQMDALVPQFATTNTTFVNDYKNARVVVSSGGGKAKPKEPTPPTPPPA